MADNSLHQRVQLAERPPRVRDTEDSIPSRSIPNTLESCSNGSPSVGLKIIRLSLRLTRWCPDKCTSSTGSLSRKRSVKHNINKKNL